MFNLISGGPDGQVLQVWLGMAITHQDLPEIFSTMCFPVVPIGSNPPMMANSMVDFFLLRYITGYLCRKAAFG